MPFYFSWYPQPVCTLNKRPVIVKQLIPKTYDIVYLDRVMVHLSDFVKRYECMNFAHVHRNSPLYRTRFVDIHTAKSSTYSKWTGESIEVVYTIHTKIDGAGCEESGIINS